MTNLFAITTAALLSIAASPVIASEARPAPAPNTEAPQAAASGARVVNPKTRYCVIETITGSRIPVKTCKTRDEWLDRGFDPLVKN
ncbi:hypothetical protein AB5I39_03195 [Sphingomonas sp. MMS24-J45]|uniref:hypothetical protein n=1 Tax=Sphingomonas sp. MMS24-J45 TaxID=3238806 RepID=UPI00384B1F63